MIDLLFAAFYEATLSMDTDGGLLIIGSHRRVLAWGMVFCLVAALALASWLCRVRRRLSLSAFAASLLIPLLIMPSLRSERIHVLPRQITMDSGTWLFPSRRTIDLSGLRSIETEDTGFRVAGYLVEANTVWTLNREGGGMDRFMFNNFFTAHRVAIAQYLRDRGLVVSR